MFHQLHEGLLFLKDRLTTFVKIESLKREESLELPEFVLRELLVNALVHRDYFERGADITIKIFPDFLEFSNPGVPSPVLNLNQIRGHSFRRNLILADLFHRVQLIERAGTGLLRIEEGLKKLSLPPLYLKEEGLFFVVRVARIKTVIKPEKSLTSADFPQDQKQFLNSRQERWLSLRVSDQLFTTDNYAKKFNITDRLARMDMKQLTDQKIVVRIRKGRRIFYHKSI